MKAVVQLVTSSSCTVDGKVTGKTDLGLFILLGVGQNDSEAEAELLAKKCADLRIFCDENDKMNLSVLDVGGSVLCVSQFTLLANTKKGNRPSFTEAMEPVHAKELYEHYMEALRNCGVREVSAGVFGADMLCQINNSGPVTILLDTDTWKKSKI